MTLAVMPSNDHLKKTAIILDLDDTIFETKSMDKKVFEPFFNHFTLTLQNYFDKSTIDKITGDLWQRPFDVVIKNYGISFSTIVDSIKLLENSDLDLNITVYEDYNFIKNLQTQKFLVTTGLTSLQTAKIKALKIENDFIKIIINDSFKDTKTKQDILSDLILEYNLVPETTFVVGDNSDSEIKAGNSFNMTTVQILRDNVIKGNNARHYIKTFNELATIIY